MRALISGSKYRRLALWFVIHGCAGPQQVAAPDLSAPCRDAAPAARQATVFSRHALYRSALEAVAHAAADGREHAVAFGKDDDDRIIRSGVGSGRFNSAVVPDVSNRFADLHNHPENRPPSSGDLYHFIDQVIATGGAYQQFILLPDGTVYALVLTNLRDAIDFNRRYPRNAGIRDTVAGMRYQPTFPGILIETINRLKGWGGASEEAALAFLLQQYKAGIALLKMSPDGHFRRINTIERLQKDGSRSYRVSSCSD